MSRFSTLIRSLATGILLAAFAVSSAIAEIVADPGSAPLPQDLSPWSMFLSANPIVKAVIVGLAFASVITWTVWLAKTVELRAMRRRVRDGLRVLGEARSLAEATIGLTARTPTMAIVEAALLETRMSSGMSIEGTKERVASRLERIEAAASRAMSRGTGILATIGSTAPFVGLFGTVWGIMDSFIGAGHRRGAARHRNRAGRRDSRRGHLQCLRALDRRLSWIAGG